MPTPLIKSFAKKSGKSVKEVDDLWNQLKAEYGEDYKIIVGALKKILKINESLYLYINSSTLNEMVKDNKIYSFTDSIRLTNNANLTEELFPHASLSMTDFNIRLTFDKNKLEENYYLQETMLIEKFAHYNLDDCISIIGKTASYDITDYITEIFICPKDNTDNKLYDKIKQSFPNITNKNRKLTYIVTEEKEKEYNLYLEAKQVGIIYHFTDLMGISKLTNTENLANYGCEIFTFVSQNKHISTTRDYKFSNDNNNKVFNTKKYNIRISLDGNKLSNKYKIKPINGLEDNDANPFGVEKNQRRVKHKEEKEEVICPLYKRGERQKFELKDYILDIQILNNENAEDILQSIKENLRINKLHIPVNIVNKWSKVINESLKGTYVSVKVKNNKELSKWFQDQGLKTIPEDKMHCTISYSRDEFKHKINKDDVLINAKDLIEIAPLGDDGCLVLKFKSDEMQRRFNQCMEEGASYDYPNYIPHSTIAIDIKDKELINNLKIPNFDIILGDESVEELDLNWKNKIKENKMSIKLKSLEEVLEAKLDEETYKEFFAKKLEKFGVKAPSELDDANKKKFFDEIDKEWKGKDEKPEPGDSKKEKDEKPGEVKEDKKADDEKDEDPKDKKPEEGSKEEEEGETPEEEKAEGDKGEEKEKMKESVDLATNAIHELSKGNSAEFISLVKDAIFVEVGNNEKYPNKDN